MPLNRCVIPGKKGEVTKGLNTAFINQVMAKMSLLDDDSDDDDLEDDEDDDEEDDINLDSFMLFMKRKAEKESSSDSEKVNADKNNIVSIANNLVTTPGRTDVIARPGSGKTSVLPVVHADAGNPSVVVLSSGIAAAGVASQNQEAKVTVGKTTIGHRDDVHYVVADDFIKANKADVRPCQGVTVFMDEMQTVDERTADLGKVAKELASTNRVVSLYGSVSGSHNLVSPDVTCCNHSEGWKNPKIGVRTLVVHPCLKRAQEARAVYGGFSFTNRFRQDVKTFKEMREEQGGFLLHTTYDQSLGLHLDLEEVYAPKTIDVNGFRRAVYVEEHMQMANRLGRFGRPGKYYGISDLRSRRATNVRTDSIMSTIRKAKKENRGKPVIREVKDSPDKKEVMVLPKTIVKCIHEPQKNDLVMQSIIKPIPNLEIEVLGPKVMEPELFEKWRFSSDIGERSIRSDDGFGSYTASTLMEQIGRIRDYSSAVTFLQMVLYNRNMALKMLISNQVDKTTYNYMKVMEVTRCALGGAGEHIAQYSFSVKQRTYRGVEDYSNVVYI